MDKVAVVYFCTGDYSQFWEGFYTSAEERFLPECEKTYFVFTDRLAEFSQYEDSLSVQVLAIPNLPWPLSTLMRYYFISEYMAPLDEFDFVVMTNANLVIRQTISEESFLPRTSKGEQYTLIDGSVAYKGPEDFPYERRSHLAAYIPMGEGSYYVRGGLVAATSEAFEHLCDEMNRMVFIDFAFRSFAIWHDESYLNRFALDRNDIRMLPGAVYLNGYDGPPTAILALDKNAYMDLDSIKSKYRSN